MRNLQGPSMGGEVKLADYTLDERAEQLIEAMTAIGAQKVSQNGSALRFVFSAHVGEFQADVRIMLNQWDVLVRGPHTLEEGHCRDDAKGVARWLLSSAQLGPKDLPPCPDCGYENFSFCRSVGHEPGVATWRYEEKPNG